MSIRIRILMVSWIVILILLEHLREANPDSSLLFYFSTIGWFVVGLLIGALWFWEYSQAPEWSLSKALLVAAVEIAVTGFLCWP